MKKILTLTLVATLTMGLFTGCQTNTGQTEDTTNTETETPSDTGSPEQNQAALERIEQLEALGALEAQIITLENVDNTELEGVTSAEKAGFIKASTADDFVKHVADIKTVSEFKAIMRTNEGDPNRAPYLLSYYTDDLIIKSTADAYDDFLYKLTINPGVEFYTEPEGFDFLMASMKNLGKTFDDFTAEFDVPNHYATIQGKDQTVETRLYFLNDGKDVEDSMYFFEVISKDALIIKVNKIDPKIDLPSIGKYFEL